MITAGLKKKNKSIFFAFLCLCLALLINFNYTPNAYATGQSWDFVYKGYMQPFTAQYAGTYKLEVWGAQGGSITYPYSSTGGYGGYSTGTISLTQGQELYVYVGGQGQSGNTNLGTSGGWNGGGGSWYYASGGGGATDIRNASDGNWQDYLNNRLIVAGGGGGSRGYANGGAGGGGTGSSGGGSNNNGGGQANWNAGIYSGYEGVTYYGAGIGYGGNGEEFGGYGGGGAGGGGYQGGRAGGPWTTPGMADGAGGGGSGYTGGVQNGSMQSGVQSGNGYARITLINTLPNAPTITSYSNGQLINTNTPTINWNFSDPDNGDYQGWYEIVASNNNWQSYYYDSGVVQSGNKYATIPSLPDGTWQFAVRTWDETGQWTPPWGYLSNITIDTTAPTGSYTLSPSSLSLNQTTITVTASDSVSGVRRIQLPDGNYVNGATATYTANQNANYTFVLEDNNGNRGNYTVPVTNVYHKPTITATPNASGNYVSLNWTAPDNWQNYSYMLYEKAPGKNEYQTIPAKSTIKVLNVYPTASYCNNGNDDLQPFTFTNWQGQTFTIPRPASVKAWMEQPNSEDPKGYGKGLISVDIVSIKDFDANPNAYLKNTDGSWKYDVVYEGAGDCNNNEDLSPSALSTIRSFIQSGRGYLGGHDTFWQYAVNRNQLASYLNMDVLTGLDFYGDTSVNIVKKGLLVSYPWNIGTIGTALNIPMSHTSQQFAKGDVWLKYTTNSWDSSAESTSYNGQTGTNNFYLTTWNNTALIETGHSGSQATPDEQKVLANTLFYLSQITDQSSWNDHTGQDVAPPNMPTITGVTPNPSQSQVNISYTSATDNGSTYSYYVEATGSANSAKSNSDTVTTTITSGVKGYSIVVDNNPNTIPDNTIETTATNYAFTYPISGNFYVHVATVDNAGNVSQVATYHFVDNNPPSLSISPNDTTFVNHAVTLTASASDVETGVWRIQTPDGNWVNSSTANFTIQTNGTYTFIAEDKAGNLTTKSISITNIDNTPPSSPMILVNSSWTNASSVPVSITSGTDGQSGVNRTEYSLSGATNQSWTTYNGVFSITNEGITTIYARSIDNVNNISVVSQAIVRIDRTSPINPSITIQVKK